MKFGDPVIYIENGQEYNAIVVSSRVFDDHLGANDEPMLDLAFFKEVLAPNAKGQMEPKKVIGTSNQSDLAQFRVDVVHDSHEYDEEQKLKHNKRVYEGGRWRHAPVANFTGRQLVGKDVQ